MREVYGNQGGGGKKPSYIPLLERRPTFTEVDLSVLRENLGAVRKLVPGSKIICIIKADAYGHGLIPIGKALEDAGADYLGTGFLEEGVILREAGVELPILVLGGVAGFQIDYFMEYDLELTASSNFIIHEIDRRARRMNQAAKVHLKIDTGMNRIGVNYRRALDFIQVAAGLPFIQVKGIYSHLASADTDPEFTQLQYQRLIELQKPAGEMFSRKIPFHLLNSAGIMNFPQGALDLVRPGLMLYGMNPVETYLPKAPVKPVLSLKSEVVFIKKVPAGEGISYNLTHTAEKDTTIVTVPIGYGDGFPFLLSNQGRALIKGRSFPIVGRVCMDQLMVDIGEERVRIGEEVVLIGSQGEERITAEEIAAKIGVIPYEVTIGITNRVPRLYLNEHITTQESE